MVLLKDNLEPRTQKHTNIVKNIKQKIPTLPCLNLPNPDTKIIVETDASDIGFGGEMSSSSSSSKTDNKKPISQKLVHFPPCPNRFSPLSPENKYALFTDVLQNKESKLVTPNISPIKIVGPFIKSPSSSPLRNQKVVPSSPNETPYIIIKILKEFKFLKTLKF
uniref:Reverse transcriptase/retrotransposon-derived protein RNase H-like domain-containing protein n=1 Tax=Lactuca sativa TaxID=4236 RepID=A0A9R1W645_LACSA|nr:hypothetical protein LSAT_V11C200067070 [Lactuca sativa]